MSQAATRAGGDGDRPTGVVLEIQRMSTEDGPGLRTTVFFKGCPLSCSWCHNPESISRQPQAQWIGSRCIACGICADECPNDGLRLESDGMRIDRASCIACGTCAAECPTTAMELMGERWELDALVSEVAKDRAYFDKSGGGITVGGGEPTLQAEFVAAFLERVRAAGIHTAVDTCGLCSTRALDAIIEHADLVLYDLKLMDAESHRAHTGADNRRILEHARHVRERMQSTGRPRKLWVRTPLIPGVTATAENLQAIGRFVATELGDVVSRWELCAFNNLCADKYLRLGLDWAFADQPLLTASQLRELEAAAKASGVDASIVLATGETRGQGPSPAVLPAAS